jgi:hypothetical protein
VFSPAVSIPAHLECFPIDPCFGIDYSDSLTHRPYIQLCHLALEDIPIMVESSGSIALCLINLCHLPALDWVILAHHSLLNLGFALPNDNPDFFRL